MVHRVVKNEVFEFCLEVMLSKILRKQKVGGRMGACQVLRGGSLWKDPVWDSKTHTEKSTEYTMSGKNMLLFERISAEIHARFHTHFSSCQSCVK